MKLKKLNKNKVAVNNLLAKMENTKMLKSKNYVNFQIYITKKIPENTPFKLALTTNETATLLKIKPTTVITFRNNILRKLECKTMPHAVFKGIHYGYIHVGSEQLLVNAS